MDISFNESIEKVRIRDIFSGLKDIFLGNNSSINNDELNKKIEEVRKVEGELGASKSIQRLEKRQQEYISEKTKRETSTKFKTERPEVKETTEVTESIQEIEDIDRDI